MSFPLDRLALQLDWNLLRTFMAIVQERSITGAAMRLNLSQPSVSAALRRLEERLELRLIERGSGQTFVITRVGEFVYREALEIYGGVVRLNDLADGQGRSLSGNLVIYRSSHLDMEAITPAIESFREQHPKVTFSIRSASCHEVSQALQQRIASIGFCTQVDPTILRLKARPLHAQEFGIYCGPKHPLFRQPDVDPQDLASSDIVGYEEDRMAGALSPLAIWRIQHGIGGRFIAAATGIVDLSELIESGTAIGCIARGHAFRYGAHLWHIPIKATPPLIDVFSLVDFERHMTPVESALLEHLETLGIASRPMPRSET